MAQVALWETWRTWSIPNDFKTGYLLLIQQRLHEEDTTAVCVEQGGYEHLYLPNVEMLKKCCPDADKTG